MTHGFVLLTVNVGLAVMNGILLGESIAKQNVLMSSVSVAGILFGIIGVVFSCLLIKDGFRG